FTLSPRRRLADCRPSALYGDWQGKKSPQNKRLLQAADLSLGARASLLSSPLRSLRAGAAMRITSAPPKHSPAQSLSVSIWNSRDAPIIFSQRGAVLSVQPRARCTRKGGS